MTKKAIKERLEYLRQELRAERISYGELFELQSLIPHIEPGDVELLEAAGVPEHPNTKYNVIIEIQIESESKHDALRYINDLMYDVTKRDTDLFYDSGNTRIVEALE